MADQELPQEDDKEEHERKLVSLIFFILFIVGATLIEGIK